MIEYFKYTPKEKDELISSMTILVDTREKVNQHITDSFDKAGVKWKGKALDYGDYSFFIPANEALSIPRDLYFDKKICIERKANLEEISGNLSQGRDRLEKEFALAPQFKVLMIENANYSDIATSNYDTKLNNKSFLASLHTFWFKYNIPLFFVPDSKFSALFIKKYFEYFLKNFIH